MPNKPSQNWMASKKNVLFVTVLWENNIWLLEAVHTWDISCRCNQMVAGAGHLRRLFYSTVWYLSWHSWGMVKGVFLSMWTRWTSHNMVIPGSQISYVAAGFPQNKHFSGHHKASYDPTSATLYCLHRIGLDTWEENYKTAWIPGGRAH